MLAVYVKSGVVERKDGRKKVKRNVVAIILQATRYRRLKTLHLPEMTKPQLAAVALTFALNHIKPKFRKKRIKIFTDSAFLHQVTKQDRKGNYVVGSRLEPVLVLRDTLDRFPDTKLYLPAKDKKKKWKDENWEELMHVYQECGLDDIILDEDE